MKSLTEAETIEAAHSGRSISRFGDGELKLATGRDAVSQRYTPELAARLKTILAAANDKTPLVCIPLSNPASPKAALWSTYERAPYKSLYRKDTLFGSPFITRPDSAPWIDRPEYWARVIDLWRGRDVILVRGSEKSLRPEDLDEADTVEEIIAPRQHAFAEADPLFQRLKGERDRRVIFCLGATATVLSFFLGLEGVHALDLGHIGMFMRRNRRLCACSKTCDSQKGAICRHSGASL